MENVKYKIQATKAKVQKDKTQIQSAPSYHAAYCLLLLLALTLTLETHSQDTIFLKNGSIIPCKIEKVGKKDVYYKIPQQTKDSMITVIESDVKEMLVKDGVDVLKMKDGGEYRGKMGKQENGRIHFHCQNDNLETIIFCLKDSVQYFIKDKLKSELVHEKSQRDTVKKNRQSIICPYIKANLLSIGKAGVKYKPFKSFSFDLSVAYAGELEYLEIGSSFHFTRNKKFVISSSIFTYSLFRQLRYNEIENRDNLITFTIGYCSSKKREFSFISNIGVAIFIQKRERTAYDGFGWPAVLPYIDLGIGYNF